MQTGLASLVHDLEEVSGSAEQEPHHPHVPRQAGQVQGCVAARVAPGRHLHLKKERQYMVAKVPVSTLGWLRTALTTFSEPE